MVTDTTPEAPASTEAAAPYAGDTPRGNIKQRFRIAQDVIATATADLPDREREALRWIAQFARAKNLDREEVASRLKQPNGKPYSGDSLYHALTGGREAGQLANMVEAIERFRRVEEERAGQVNTGFIETVISKRIFAACRKAFLRRKILFLFGESQTGKTTGLREYARTHNHGETIYVRMPTGGALDSFVRELALILGIPTGNRVEDLRRRIIECFDDRMLLVVDEVHECLSEHYSAKRGLRTLNFIREIHDRRGCGVVLSATPVFRQAMLMGPHARNLRQLWLRGMAPLQLPARPGEADLHAFAAAYGLGPAPAEETTVKLLDDAGNQLGTVKQSPAKLQASVIADYGLGRWNMILAEASDLAAEKRKPLTWGTVIRAWHDFEALSEFDEPAA